MDFELIIKISYIVIPVIVGLVGIYFKKQDARIAKLEELIVHFVTKEELRISLEDRLEPIREGISDMKAKLDKLYDYLLKK